MSIRHIAQNGRYLSGQCICNGIHNNEFGYVKSSIQFLISSRPQFQYSDNV